MNKDLLGIVFQLGSTVRADIAESRMNKAKTAMVRVASNWEVKFDPATGPTTKDVTRFAGEGIIGKEVVRVNEYLPTHEGNGIRVLFYITTADATEAPKPVKAK